MKIFKISLVSTLSLLTLLSLNVTALENCKWDNSNGLPCVTISKTPNTSFLNSQSVGKQIFTKQNIHPEVLFMCFQFSVNK